MESRKTLRFPRRFRHSELAIPRAGNVWCMPVGHWVSGYQAAEKTVRVHHDKSHMPYATAIRLRRGIVCSLRFLDSTWQGLEQACSAEGTFAFSFDITT